MIGIYTGVGGSSPAETCCVFDFSWCARFQDYLVTSPKTRLFYYRTEKNGPILIPSEIFFVIRRFYPYHELKPDGLQNVCTILVDRELETGFSKYTRGYK